MLLPTKGIFNVRDLGGHTAADGRRVKSGLLYRAGDLCPMTDGDRALLEDLGIATVVDFRADVERRERPDDTLATVRNYAAVPIEPGNFMGMAFTVEGAADEMHRLYDSLPGDGLPAYRKLFSLLADPANCPLLFHCSAGKDRTGFAAALILTALGVDEAAVMEDYLASEGPLNQRWGALIKREPQAAPYLTVRRSYLERAIKAVEGRGGFERYLTGELGADLAHLRNLYTE
jgi:protein-tyrosine phosphatase